jgi:hypothetical protein
LRHSSNASYPATHSASHPYSSLQAVSISYPLASIIALWFFNFLLFIKLQQPVVIRIILILIAVNFWQFYEIFLLNTVQCIVLDDCLLNAAFSCERVVSFIPFCQAYVKNARKQDYNTLKSTSVSTQLSTFFVCCQIPSAPLDDDVKKRGGLYSAESEESAWV